MSKDATINVNAKPWAVLKLWNGQLVSGTMLEDHGDGTATIQWDRGPWRGKIVSQRDHREVEGKNRRLDV
jgi:hypothetical protein